MTVRICFALILILFASPLFGSMRSIPVAFELNRGQYPAGVSHRARARSYDVYLTTTGANIVMTDERGQSVVRMRFADTAEFPAIVSSDPLRGVINHFIGNDPSAWRTGVPTFGSVRYEQIYPGVDVVFYGYQDLVEYDFIVSPGASPEVIRMRFEDVDGLTIGADGSLEIEADDREMTLRPPHVYQTLAGVRRPVEARYALDRHGHVIFDVDDHDEDALLVIDPLIVRYSTHLGGSADDVAFGVAVDGDRNAYVTGTTASSDFLSSDGAVQLRLAGGRDFFVTKVSADGSSVIYSTYIGGSGIEDGWGGITVDAAGNAYVTGTTRSRDFPTTSGAFQQEFGGGPDDAVIFKLSSDGSSLLYSTYLGGSGEDQSRAIAIDRHGNAYVTGRTMSVDFPVRDAFQPIHGGNVDAFITRLSTDGSELSYSSFLGGTSVEVGRAIAVDAAGGAYVAGRTLSSNFPATPGAFQTSFAGSGPMGQGDAIAARVRPDGTLAYATYIGGSRGEIGAGIAVDRAGNAYVSGITESLDFPTSEGSYQPEFAGGAADGFLIKLDPTGSEAIYSSYLGGGAGDDEIFDVAVDPRGAASVTGVTFSRSFPTVDPVQSSFGGAPNDAFIARFDPSGSSLLFSTYAGGDGVENGFRIAVDSGGNVYATGGTRSRDFPTTAGAIMPDSGGGEDVFIISLAWHDEESRGGERRIIPVVGSTAGYAGSFFRTSVQLHNAGEAIIDGTIGYRPAASGEESNPIPFMIAPKQTIAFNDLLPLLGLSGVGSADIRFVEGEEPVVAVRIFEDGGDSGTSGMSQNALAPDAALRPGERGILIAPADPVAARLNIGMRALSEGATIRFERRTSSGESAGIAERVLQPEVFLQLPASDLVGGLGGNDSISVEVTSGGAVVYGATNDNRTHDPSLQLARFEPSVENEMRIVPVAGSLSGAFGSSFRTSVQLHNPFATTQMNGRIVFHPAGTSGSEADRSLEYTLAAFETIGWSDLPAEMGAEGLGSLEIESLEGPLPVSLIRVYNDLGELGTRGMTEEMLRTSDALHVGDVAVLLVPLDPQRTRFNLGIRTLEEGATIEATIYDRAGVGIGGASISIPPRQLIQSSASALLGIATGGSDAVHLEVTSGSAFIYGTSTDNRSNDPAIEIARRSRR